MADSKQNYGATSAPLVVNDLVFSGASGGDEGVRGFLEAYKQRAQDHRTWLHRHQAAYYFGVSMMRSSVAASTAARV